MNLYKLSGLMIAMLFISCGDKANTSGDAHGHSQDESHDTNGDHDEHKEEGHKEGVVELTAAQFKALKIEVDTVSMQVLSGYVETNGELEVPPQNEAAITSIVGATVASISVIEGDEVKKNQVVGYLSHPAIIQTQTNYLEAVTNQDLLDKEYQRQKKLYDAGVASGMSFQSAESSFTAAKAKVKGLEAQLKLLNINSNGVKNGTIYSKSALLSPINGFIQKVNVRTGQYVEPQTELFEVVDNHHVHADFMVFEKDASKIEVGQVVKFSVQSNEGEMFTAKIISVGKTFEEQPKAIHVHAEIDNKKDHLIPGMYVSGRILINSVKSMALPTGSIINDGDLHYVFSAKKHDENWEFEPVQVILGVQDDNWTEISFKNPEDSKRMFAMNNAYYLVAEMKKGEAEHSH